MASKGEWVVFLPYYGVNEDLMIALILVSIRRSRFFWFQIEFDEKELRKKIYYAIKNFHGVK